MKIIQSVLISLFILSGVVSFAQSMPSDTAAPKPESLKVCTLKVNAMPSGTTTNT
jgi:hypothetical protein